MKIILKTLNFKPLFTKYYIKYGMSRSKKIISKQNLIYIVQTKNNDVCQNTDFGQNINLDGKGIIKYTNNMFYNGHVKNGLFHGKGKLTLLNFPNVYFKGHWKNGMKHGTGRYVNKLTRNGYDCVGKWINDKMTFVKLIRFKNGLSYSGTTVNGRLTGQGKIFKNNNLVYKGNIVNGKIDGHGEFFSSSLKMWCCGIWLSSRISECVIKNEKNKMIYKGSFENLDIDCKNKICIDIDEIVLVNAVYPIFDLPNPICHNVTKNHGIFGMLKKIISGEVTPRNYEKEQIGWLRRISGKQCYSIEHMHSLKN